MLHSSIGLSVLGIGIARGQYNWILGVLLGIVLTLIKMIAIINLIALRCPSESLLSICMDPCGLTQTNMPVCVYSLTNLVLEVLN